MADKDYNDMFCLAITTVKLGEVSSSLKHSCCLLKSQSLIVSWNATCCLGFGSV